MIGDYANWLKNEISIKKMGEYYELTTPYLDRYNDYLQIYVKQDEKGRINITDDGYILRNLNSCGINFRRSSKRQDMLYKIIQTYGVELQEDSLITTATMSNFPQKKHMLVQAMLTIDDMFMAEPNTVKSFFVEDIGAYLDSHEIFYTRDLSLIGKTGSIYNYDYHLQRTRHRPERFCKAINKLTESSRNLALFNWVDTIERRTDAANMIVFINDEHPTSKTDLEAFLSYNVDYILWSERNQFENIGKLTG